MNPPTPRIWLITDTHFFHDQIVELCGRPANHRERITAAWRRLVAADDLVYHLGDITVGKDLEAATSIQALPGRKVLIRGNHDRKSMTWYLTHGWVAVAESVLLELHGERILLSHVPQRDDATFTVNVHGHFHNSDYRRYEPELAGRLTEKHVLLAIEATRYEPVQLGQAVQWYQRRKRTADPAPESPQP